MTNKTGSDGGNLESLTFAVAVVCSVALTLSVALATTAPRILYYTGAYVSTVAGFIASIVTVFTLMKVAHFIRKQIMCGSSSPNFSARAWVIAIFSAAGHITTSLISFVGCFHAKSLEKSFAKAVSEYQRVPTQRHFVDIIQWSLQCCGAHSYLDWFNTDWKGVTLLANSKSARRNVGKSVSTSDYEDLNFLEVRSDSVPYSCCRIDILAPCIHDNVNQQKNFTINTCGCSTKLYKVAFTIFLIELLIFTLISVIIIILICVMKIEVNEHNEKCEPKKRPCKYKRLENAKPLFDSFTNVQSESSKENEDESSNELASINLSQSKSAECLEKDKGPCCGRSRWNPLGLGKNAKCAKKYAKLGQDEESDKTLASKYFYADAEVQVDRNRSDLRALVAIDMKNEKKVKKGPGTITRIRRRTKELLLKGPESGSDN